MVARKEWWWEDNLNQVLLTKPAEVVQEACQVLEKHGCSVKKLKSELYYSSTLCQVVFKVLHYANLIVAHAPTAWTALMHISTINFVEGCIPNCVTCLALTHMLMQILLQWRSQVMLVPFARHTCMSRVCVYFVFE